MGSLKRLGVAGISCGAAKCVRRTEQRVFGRGARAAARDQILQSLARRRGRRVRPPRSRGACRCRQSARGRSRRGVEEQIGRCPSGRSNFTCAPLSSISIAATGPFPSGLESTREGRPSASSASLALGVASFPSSTTDGVPPAAERMSRGSPRDQRSDFLRDDRGRSVWHASSCCGATAAGARRKGAVAAALPECCPSGPTSPAEQRFATDTCS